MTNNITAIPEDSPLYPHVLRGKAGEPLFPTIWTIGNPTILDKPLLGFFCSRRCPGDIILQIYDTAKKLRHSQTPVISGFHTPMEKELLDLLLRGKQPLVICPARSLLKMRIPKIWKPAIAQGRLLVLSPFAENHHRITTTLSAKRNRLVSHIAHEILIYAAPDSKTELLCNKMIESGKTVIPLRNSGDIALNC
jgi:predicted Rossmann fold nucleotide-binding protein DprA/Smf involved in DNA uptake